MEVKNVTFDFSSTLDYEEKAVISADFLLKLFNSFMLNNKHLSEKDTIKEYIDKLEKCEDLENFIKSLILVTEEIKLIQSIVQFDFTDYEIYKKEV